MMTDLGNSKMGRPMEPQNRGQFHESYRGGTGRKKHKAVLTNGGIDQGATNPKREKPTLKGTCLQVGELKSEHTFNSSSLRVFLKTRRKTSSGAAIPARNSAKRKYKYTKFLRNGEKQRGEKWTVAGAAVPRKYKSKTSRAHSKQTLRKQGRGDFL